VVAGLDLVPGAGIGRGGGGGEREQGGLEGGGVLDAAPAAEADAAGAVLGDRQEPVEVGGPVGAVEVAFGGGVGPVGIGDREQVPGGLGEVGGGQPGGLVQEQGLGAVPQAGPVREPVHGIDDHRGLLGRDPGLAQRGVGGGQLGGQLPGLGHGAVPGAAVGAGQVGEPLRGRAPAQLGLGDLAGVELGQQRGLDRGQPAAQRLELRDGVDQLLGAPRGPQHLAQPGQGRTRVGDHPGRGARCRRELLHDPTQPETTDTHAPLTCGYLTIREISETVCASFWGRQLAP